MRSTMATVRMSLVPMAVLLVLPGSARAQAPVPGNDKVSAEALFEDGRKLVASGKYSEACSKFADSERLDPSPSTLLNLANCWEKLGRIATAWATYKEAESAASAAKRQDYVATAQRHADALAPKLARLTINAQQPIAGMQLRRDGVVVGSSEWGAAMPIDGGGHSIEASAPGYKEWATQVDVTQDGAQIVITVPPLEALPAEPPSQVPASTITAGASAALPPAQPEVASDASPRRTIGLVVGAAGVVGLAVSGVFALVANSKNKDSKTHCPQSPTLCDQTGVDLRGEALSAGDAATVALGIGAVALAGGAVLWLTAPSRTAAPTAGARVVVTPTLGGALVKGTW
jgi:hypothetical protein